MDDLAIPSMTSSSRNTRARITLHSGLGLRGRLEAWGLGDMQTRKPERNLPGYVVLNGGQIPSGGLDNFGADFFLRPIRDPYSMPLEPRLRM